MLIGAPSMSREYPNYSLLHGTWLSLMVMTQPWCATRHSKELPTWLTSSSLGRCRSPCIRGPLSHTFSNIFSRLRLLGIMLPLIHLLRCLRSPGMPFGSPGCCNAKGYTMSIGHSQRWPAPWSSRPRDGWSGSCGQKSFYGCLTYRCPWTSTCYGMTSLIPPTATASLACCPRLW